MKNKGANYPALRCAADLGLRRSFLNKAGFPPMMGLITIVDNVYNMIKS